MRQHSLEQTLHCQHQNESSFPIANTTLQSLEWVCILYSQRYTVTTRMCLHSLQPTPHCHLQNESPFSTANATSTVIIMSLHSLWLTLYSHQQNESAFSTANATYSHHQNESAFSIATYSHHQNESAFSIANATLSAEWFCILYSQRYILTTRMSLHSL